MTDTPTPAARAFDAAENLAHATAELLRFAREGPSTDRYPFQLDDITELLAEALLFTLRTETEAVGDSDCARIDRSHNGHLCAALATWLIDACAREVPD